MLAAGCKISVGIITHVSTLASGSGGCSRAENMLNIIKVFN